jgi:hypothetical protein
MAVPWFSKMLQSATLDNLALQMRDKAQAKLVCAYVMVNVINQELYRIKSKHMKSGLRCVSVSLG